MSSEPTADLVDDADGSDGAEGIDGNHRTVADGFGPDWPLQDRAGTSQSWPTGLQPVPEMNGWAVRHAPNGALDSSATDWTVAENGAEDRDGDEDGDDIAIDPFDLEVGAAPFTITADLTEVFGPPGRGDAPVSEAPKPPRPPHIEPIKPRRRSVEVAAEPDPRAAETPEVRAAETALPEAETVGAAPPMPPRSLAVDGPGEPPSAFPHGEDDVEWGGS